MSPPAIQSILVLLLLAARSHSHPNHQLDLTYTQPGVSWKTDVLPLGNGYFGALILGGVVEDRLRITDPMLRDGHGQLQPLADLVIGTGHDPEHARTFLRRLDLQTASVEVSYRAGRVRHRREYFASYPDRVLVGRLRAMRKKSLDLTISWDCGHALARTTFDTMTRRLAVAGENPRFRAEAEFRLEGGDIRWEDDRLQISGADEVTLLLALANYSEPVEKESQLDRLRHEDAISLYRRHLPDYQEHFHAMYLTLEGGAKTHLVTSKRRQLYMEKPEEDPGFEELLFQYGRYLLQASSRGKSPAPLQARGIWWFPPAAAPLDNRPIEGRANLSALIRAGAGPSQLGVKMPEKSSLFPLPDLGPWLEEQDTALGHVAHLIERANAGEGNGAYARLRRLLQTNLAENLLVTHHNLAANMALVRGMCDLFARERDGVLQWGTGLPDAWPDGSVVGLRTPNYEVAYVWQDGKFFEGYLTRLEAGAVKVKSQTPLLLDQPGTDAKARRLEPDEQGILRFHLEGETTMRLRAMEDAPEEPPFE